MIISINRFLNFEVQKSDLINFQKVIIHFNNGKLILTNKNNVKGFAVECGDLSGNLSFGEIITDIDISIERGDKENIGYMILILKRIDDNVEYILSFTEDYKKLNKLYKALKDVYE